MQASATLTTGYRIRARVAKADVREARLARIKDIPSCITSDFASLTVAADRSSWRRVYGLLARDG